MPPDPMTQETSSEGVVVLYECSRCDRQEFSGLLIPSGHYFRGERCGGTARKTEYVPRASLDQANERARVVAEALRELPDALERVLGTETTCGAAVRAFAKGWLHDQLSALATLPKDSEGERG